jgi:hypothetical protein
MDLQPLETSAWPEPESPGAGLDAFALHPEWDERRRDAELERLIVRFPPDQLRAAVGARLGNLDSIAGEPLLRLVESLADRALLERLAEALLAQPGLRPERAWSALTLLDDAGLLDRYPELAERWDELNEMLAEDSSLEQLAAQIEEDPDGMALALQGLAAIEPEVRTEIIGGLSRLVPQPGPQMHEFFRLLSFAHEPATRTAALGALADLGITPLPAPRPVPRLLHSLVTALDGNGRGLVGLSATNGTTRSSAAFVCDVRHGVSEVFGEVVDESPLAEAFLEELAGSASGARHVLDAPGLAEGLLKAALLLCGPGTTPALHYWLERTLGPDVVPHAFPIPFPDWDPKLVAAEGMAERAALVLEACPSWSDASDLTHEIALELLLRGDAPPDPRRDAGAYRYLFEHQLRGQLELYRRMLLWMASFWQAAGDPERGKAALALAVQLSDEQHAVPGHPFTVALLTRSLASAQARLRSGDDPRRVPGPGA